MTYIFDGIDVPYADLSDVEGLVYELRNQGMKTSLPLPGIRWTEVSANIEVPDLKLKTSLDIRLGSLIINGGIMRWNGNYFRGTSFDKSDMRYLLRVMESDNRLLGMLQTQVETHRFDGPNSINEVLMIPNEKIPRTIGEIFGRNLVRGKQILTYKKKPIAKISPEDYAIISEKGTAYQADNGKEIRKIGGLLFKLNA